MSWGWESNGTFCPGLKKSWDIDNKRKNWIKKAVTSDKTLFIISVQKNTINQRIQEFHSCLLCILTTKRNRLVINTIFATSSWLDLCTGVFSCINVIQCCYVLSKSRFSKVAAPPGKAIFGYLVFHVHSAPHYFLFFVISEPKKQFKPRINNGSRSLLFSSTFGFSAAAGASPSLKAWGGGDGTDSDCEWSESSLIPTLALSFPAESFSNPLNPVKNLCPFSTLGFFFFFFFFCVASLSLVRQTIGSTAKDAQKRNRASESDVTYASRS